ARGVGFGRRDSRGGVQPRERAGGAAPGVGGPGRPRASGGAGLLGEDGRGGRAGAAGQTPRPRLGPVPAGLRRAGAARSRGSRPWLVVQGAETHCTSWTTTPFGSVTWK